MPDVRYFRRNPNNEIMDDHNNAANDVEVPFLPIERRHLIVNL